MINNFHIEDIEIEDEGNLKARQLNQDYKYLTIINKLLKSFKRQLEADTRSTRVDTKVRNYLRLFYPKMESEEVIPIKGLMLEMQTLSDKRLSIIEGLFELQKTDDTNRSEMISSRDMRGATLSNDTFFQILDSDSSPSKSSERGDIASLLSPIRNQRNFQDSDSEDEKDSRDKQLGEKLMYGSCIEEEASSPLLKKRKVRRDRRKSSTDKRNIVLKPLHKYTLGSKVLPKSHTTGSLELGDIIEEMEREEALQKEKSKKQLLSAFGKLLIKQKNDKKQKDNKTKLFGAIKGLLSKSTLPASLSPHSQTNNKFSSKDETILYNEKASKKIEEEFEDIERLTSSDPGTYFTSKPSLLAKASYVCLSDFEYLETLGAGAYGRVYLVRKKATGDFFAIKVIGSDSEVSRAYIDNLLNEREVFSVIDSDFCVNALATFVHKSLVCFVMEYLPGKDLFDIIFEEEEFCLDSFSIQFYLAEIILGIEALHINGIVHRDIKPANILLDNEGHIKITDFGLSEFRDKIGGFQNVSEDSKAPVVLIKGSANYLAPEVVRGEPVSFGVDWWALGVMAYLFINEEFPFDGESIQEVHEKIRNQEVEWPNVGREEDQMTPELQDLIAGLLNKDPELRLGANGPQEIKEHPFFKNIYWKENAEARKLPVYAPENVIDLSQYDKVGGQDLEEFVKGEFKEVLAQEDSKLMRMGVPFSNKFELVRTDTLHRKNKKIAEKLRQVLVTLGARWRQ